MSRWEEGELEDHVSALLQRLATAAADHDQLDARHTTFATRISKLVRYPLGNALLVT